MSKEIAMANWTTHNPNTFLEFCMKTFPQDTFKVATDYDQVIYIQPSRIEFKEELEEIGDNMTLAQVKMLVDSIQYTGDLFVWKSEAAAEKGEDDEFVDFRITNLHTKADLEEKTEKNEADSSPSPVIPDWVPLGSKSEEDQGGAVEASGELEELLKENKDLKEKNGELELKISEIEKELEEKSKGELSSDETVSQLKEEATELQEQNKTLKGDIETLEEKLASGGEAEGAASGEHVKEIEKLQKENEKLKKKNESLEGKLASQGATSELRAQIDKLVKEKEKLEKKPAPKGKTAKALSAKRKKKIKGLQDKIEKLEKEVGELEKQASAEKTESSGLEEEIKELQENIEELEKANKELEAQISAAPETPDESSDSGKEFDEVKTKLAKYEDMVVRMKDKFPDFGSAMQKILLYAELDKRLGKKK